MVKRIIIFLSLSLLAWPLGAQVYTVSSFDSAEVKIGKEAWRGLTIADTRTVRLNERDGVKVISGKLALRRSDDYKAVRIAYPGIWTVKDVWNKKALPKEPNTTGPADTERGMGVGISVDFLTPDGYCGNVFAPGDSLAGVVVSNHGNETIYAYMYAIDNEPRGAVVRFLRFTTMPMVLDAGQVTYLDFENVLTLDEGTSDTTVLVVYSKELLPRPSLSMAHKEEDVISILEDYGFGYVTRIVQYSK